MRQKLRTRLFCLFMGVFLIFSMSSYGMLTQSDAVAMFPDDMKINKQHTKTKTPTKPKNK